MSFLFKNLIKIYLDIERKGGCVMRKPSGFFVSKKAALAILTSIFLMVGLTTWQIYRYSKLNAQATKYIHDHVKVGVCLEYALIQSPDNCESTLLIVDICMGTKEWRNLEGMDSIMDGIKKICEKRKISI
jgi:hypothetical protein